MLNKMINFEDLRKILLSLGFKQYKYEKAFLFKHDQTDASIALPETVYPRHVEAVKRMVVYKGVLDNPEAFDQLAERHQVQT